MLVLITYDVSTETDGGKKRLRQIAKLCVNHGQRVQNSVFECILDPVQLKVLQKSIDAIMDKKTDSVRYYNLGKNWKRKVEHIGAKESYDPEGFLMI
jgi:CRISPR-associated protein Cas2